jgi:hypothetical protein
MPQLVKTALASSNTAVGRRVTSAQQSNVARFRVAQAQCKTSAAE